MSALRPIHGGNLLQAVARFGGTPEQWLDLSAALNPQPYPAAATDPALWYTLPQPDAALHAAACAYR